MRVASVLFGFALAVDVSAQSRLKEPRFEVASIKASPPPDGPMGVLPGVPQPGGRWSAKNAPLLTILRMIYPEFSKPGQIQAGAKWVSADRWNIEARYAAGTAYDEVRAMAQVLIAERFHLVTHTELRQVPVFLLVRANATKLGPRLRSGSGNCINARLTAECVGGSRRNTARQFRARDQELALLVDDLTFNTDRPILDRTGLSGLFDIDLEWSAAVSDPNAVPLFTALEEQLGLKLISNTSQMGVLVIDHIERPTEN